MKYIGHWWPAALVCVRPDEFCPWTEVAQVRTINMLFRQIDSRFDAIFSTIDCSFSNIIGNSFFRRTTKIPIVFFRHTSKSFSTHCLPFQPLPRQLPGRTAPENSLRLIGWARPRAGLGLTAPVRDPRPVGPLVGPYQRKSAARREPCGVRQEIQSGPRIPIAPHSLRASANETLDPCWF